MLPCVQNIQRKFWRKILNKLLYFRISNIYFNSLFDSSHSQFRSSILMSSSVFGFICLVIRRVFGLSARRLDVRGLDLGLEIGTVPGTFRGPKQVTLRILSQPHYLTLKLQVSAYSASNEKSTVRPAMQNTSVGSQSDNSHESKLPLLIVRVLLNGVQPVCRHIHLFPVFWTSLLVCHQNQNLKLKFIFSHATHEISRLDSLSLLASIYIIFKNISKVS